MDKELIEHIATQLHSHEEVYSSGAWERFSIREEKKKRQFVYWPLWSAAALVLIIGGLFFSLDNSEINNPALLSKSKIKTESPSQGKSINREKIADLKAIDDQKDTSKVLSSIYRTGSPRHIKNLGTVSTVQSNDTNVQGNYSNYNKLDGQISNTSLSTNSGNRNFNIVVQQKKRSAKLSFEELLAQDSFKESDGNISKTDEHTKWQPDVYVAPVMGNDNKINMNYGFSLSYAIANKVSISSGISYSALSTREVLDATTFQAFSGKSLESIDASVRGINIPLELKYNISDRLYTGIGISALAVLNNKQQNNYISNQIENVSITNASGFAEQKTLIVKERSTELQPGSNIDPDKYIGFYNFSLGYKQKISSKKNIAIEPFLRVPMKTFSKENLNLTNGGLRLKIDF